MFESPVMLQEALEVVEELSSADQLRLVAALADRLRQNLQELSPPQAQVRDGNALEHAIALYRQDQVTLSRAAEMAGVTRWELMQQLKEQGHPVTVQIPPVEEMDRDLIAYLE